MIFINFKFNFVNFIDHLQISLNQIKLKNNFQLFYSKKTLKTTYKLNSYV